MGNTVKTVLLLGLLSGLLLVVGELLGGRGGLVVAVGIAVVMNFGSYWFSDKIVLRMYRTQQVGEGHALYEMTAARPSGRFAHTEGLHYSGRVA